MIELFHVSKSYDAVAERVLVLRDVSLSIAPGEFVALMGASGSGKTTLMNILGCLDVPSSGDYRFEGEDVARLSSDQRATLRVQRIGFVFQTFNLLPRTDALQNVLMPLTYAPGAPTIEEARRRAQDLLERMGLGERLLHQPSQLSGGQQQRVAIARALVNRPSLLLADEPTGNLDSSTSADVLRVIRRLNIEQGVTVVLVTHEEDVARHADRILRIQDGRIVADERQRAFVASQALAEAPSPNMPTQTLARPAGFTNLLRTALQGLSRNRLRAALTTLGIVIGIAAVIAMMEIGRGSATAINKTIASMGANNVLVLPGTASSGGVSFGAGSVMTLTPQDSDAIAAQASFVKASAPVVRARAQIVYADRNWVPISIIGTTSEYLDVREWGLTDGEPFSDRDVRNSNRVCLIGQRLVRELFGNLNPLGKEVRVQNVPFVVSGVLAPKGANMMGMDQDDILIAPWTTIKYRIAGATTTMSPTGQATPAPSAGGQIYPGANMGMYPPRIDRPGDVATLARFANVDQIVAAAISAAAVSPAVDEMTEILRVRHRIRPDEQDDFSVRDMTEMTSVITTTSAVMTKLLLAVSLISLVVGGVGIMNIMLVSVTERTREIGLRMAVGARRIDMLRQFLMESVLLCLLGGIAGIAVGRGISIAIRVLLHWPIEVSWDAIAAACLVSVSVGMMFGYYPHGKQPGRIRSWLYAMNETRRCLWFYVLKL